MTNIYALQARPPRGKPLRAPRLIRLARRQGCGAAGIGAVALVLTALSLTHLAHGIEIVTRAPAWEAWSMAVGIDLGFVALELAQLAASDQTRKAIRRYCTPAIAGTLIGSAILNAFAFGAQASGSMVAPAIALGLAVPALIYAMTRVGAVMWLSRRAA